MNCGRARVWVDNYCNVTENTSRYTVDVKPLKIILFTVQTKKSVSFLINRGHLVLRTKIQSSSSRKFAIAVSRTHEFKNGRKEENTTKSVFYFLSFQRSATAAPH